jgi:tetratricopeptide (TPR) repeat protein
MKKTIITATIVILALFVIITITRNYKSDPTTQSSDAGEATTERGEKIANFWSVYRKAEAFMNQGALDDAIEYFQKAGELDPQHELTLYNLGNLYYESGRFDEAVSTFNRLIEVNPRAARPHRRIGEILSHPIPGAPLDLDKARISFEKALNLNSEQSGTHYWMGRILIELGKFDEGRKYIANATRLNPKFPEAMTLVAYSHLLDGNYTKAIDGYMQALDMGVTKIKPGELPGEGDTRESLKSSPPTGHKNIGALYGLALASSAVGGYPSNVPDEYRTKLPVCPQIISKASPVFEGNAKPDGIASSWIDYDDDGDFDLLLVGPYSPLKLWRHEGQSRFTDVTATVGLARAGKGWDILNVDFDLDGDQDIYLLRGGWSGSKGGLLLENKGGKFVDATPDEWASEIKWTGCVRSADFNQDGYPDLIEVGRNEQFVPEVRIYGGSANGFAHLWRMEIAGSGFPIDCSVGDFNNDSHPDFFILRWRGDGLLFKNLNGDDFADVTGTSGIEVSFESLSATFLDFNNDGLLDLFVSALASYPDALRTILDLKPETDRGRPVLYINKGNDVFELMSPVRGLARHYGTLDAFATDLNGDDLTDLYLSNGGLEFSRIEPDAILVNQDGEYFTCEYVNQMASKSQSISVCHGPHNGGMVIFVTRGGLAPGEKKEGVLYITAEE